MTQQLVSGNFVLGAPERANNHEQNRQLNMCGLREVGNTGVQLSTHQKQLKLVKTSWDVQHEAAS